MGGYGILPVLLVDVVEGGDDTALVQLIRRCSLKY